jgi:isochorismate synthase
LAHIRTDFTAKCNPTKASQLLIALHPTPAVCGTPTQGAKKEILKTEAHNRMYYSGFLGLFAPQKFNIFVNLRCMLVDADSFYLFVGGGLTKDSDPKAEWDETENKAGVLERVIQ